MKVFRKLLFTSLFVFAFLALFSSSAFAEEDGILNCSGKIMGSVSSGNVNAGVTNFDSHPQGGGEATPTADGGIIGVEDIVAPGTRELAACVQINGAFGDDPKADTFNVKGYAWNENLGFISMSGALYGVTIGPEVGGVRNVGGYAWNDVFGYLNFDQPQNPAGVVFMDPVGWVTIFDGPGVTLAADGTVSGYAWSEAGVWVDMSGIRIELPGQELEKVVIGEDWCEQLPKPPICIQVDPLPETLSQEFDLNAGITGDVKVADGKDYYDIVLYFRAEDGVTGVPYDYYDNFDLHFNWTDTLKADQTIADSVENRLVNIVDPWTHSEENAAIVYKPISLSKNTFLNTFQHLAGDPVGVYRLKPETRIRSMAPTSESNISFTTSTDPEFEVKNEIFVNNVGRPGEVELNELILHNIDYSVLKAAVWTEGVVHPNGKAGLRFKFMPAIALETLYANGLMDSIQAFRNVPVNFTLGVEKYGDLNYQMVDNSLVTLQLAFDGVKTDTECNNLPNPDEKQLINNFVFAFMKDGMAGDAVQYPIASDSFKGAVQAMPSLPAFNPESDNQLPCNVMQGPSLYSIVQYKPLNNNLNKTVKYYGNKLPRIASSIDNPEAVVHGNIYAPKAFSPTASQKTQATGNVSVDVVRNTVNENLNKYVPTLLTQKDPAECLITKLRLEGKYVVEDCTESVYFKHF